MEKTSLKIDLKAIREKGLVVMTPCYGGVNHTSYTSSMIDLSIFCTQHGIPFTVYFLKSESLIQRARNYCADKFLNMPFSLTYEDGTVEERKYGFGVFIDSDIAFKSVDVMILLQYLLDEDKDIVCGPYPRKSIAWEKVREATDRGIIDGRPADTLELFTGDFVFNLANGNTLAVNEPFEVLESGTGFMAFTRETLEKWAAAYPEKQYTPDHIRSTDFDGSRKITAFFDCIIDPDTNRYLSEDYYFCQMARKAGMKVWLVPWIKLVHTGSYDYNGSLVELVHHGFTPTVDARQIGK